MAAGGCCPPMDLMRSEPMHLVQLIIPTESSHRAISYVGELGLIQFKDLNAEKSPFQRTYAAQIKKCGEMARRLRFFKEQILQAGISLPSKPWMRNDIKVDDLEVKLAELEAELTEINANNEKLRRTYNDLSEYKLVLQKAGEFFHSAQRSATAQQREIESQQTGEESLDTPLLKEDDFSSSDSSKNIQLGFFTGLVPRDKSMPFERILFRATRGNVFLRQVAVDNPVIDPASGEKMEKNVFVVFYSGERAKNKILKICEAFGANRYPFSEDVGKQAQMMTEVFEYALNEESFEASVRDYTKIIHLYAKHNRIQDAENALVSMTQRGMICDQVTLTTMIHMYSKADNFEKAEEIFEEMKLLGHPLDKRSYGSMIMAYIRAGMPDKGESLVLEKDALEIYAGREVYKALLRVYSMKGDCEGAQRVLNAIQLSGTFPDDKQCALLINAYVVARQTQKARIAFENMRRVGIVPNDKCVAVLLAGYEKENNLNAALDLLIDLEKDGILVGKEASELLAAWFQRIGVAEEVALVLREYAAK